VQETYFQAAGQRSFLDSFRGNSPGVANPPQDSPREKMLRDQLSRLPERQRVVVQLALWDQLDLTELAEVLRISPDEAGDRLQRALGRYSELVARKEPAHDSGDLAAAIRRLKPGRHSRWGTATG
jgi:DNA-directed RNA polymerase specialized sigma24 family protein